MIDAGSCDVPRSRVARTHRAMRSEILEAIEPIIFDAPMHGYAVRAALEEAFAAAVEAKYASAVHSGTIGLFLALRACNVGAGDEVITVGNSDVSTTASISQCGAVPVLCDVNRDDYTMNVDLVEGLITPRTRVLMPVDLYGHPSDVRRLREIAERHGLRIVEDAALATGAADHGLPVGAFADVTVFSFAPFKPLGSVGNGAMVTTNDSNVARRVRLLTGYGHTLDNLPRALGHQAHVEEGYNVPLDPLQAALVGVKLPYLSTWTKMRRQVVDWYRNGLARLDVRMPKLRPESEPTFRSFTILVEDQAMVHAGLLGAGVETVLHYTPPVYRQPVYPDGLRGCEHLPVTEELARQLVCLPVTIELGKSDILHAVEALRELVGERPRVG